MFGRSLVSCPEPSRQIAFEALFIFAAITVLPVTGVTAGSLPPGLVGPEIPGLEIPTVRMESVDHQALEAEDLGKPTGPGTAGPMRFAVGLETSIKPETSGRWDRLSDGWDLWRVKIDSPGALSLNLRIEDLNLPAGSSLWIHDPLGAQVHGPYIQADRDSHGGLSTPIVLGDHLVIEVATPPGRTSDVRLMISSVHHGYRIFGEEHGPPKQGDCNIDVICPEGDSWRDQIRSVARYSIDGTYLCTGTLMNNTAEDDRPLFLTADHCGVRAGNANTVVVYWNYESSNCGDLSGGSLSQNQIGAAFLSTWDWDNGSDFTLIELDEIPDSAFGVYYAGWDVSGQTPQLATGIHHPSGYEKSISFENDPLSIIWGSHWKVNDWDLGTTEPGSSGSCLFDQSNGLCVGTLSGGYAACGNDLEDWYGQIDKSWTGNGTPDSRLSDHLDPLGLGVTTLQGRNPAEIFSNGFESGDLSAWSDLVLGAPLLAPGTWQWLIDSQCNGVFVPCSLIFYADGSFLSPERCSGFEDSWSQIESTVEFSFSSCDGIYTGALNSTGTFMSGTVSWGGCWQATWMF